MAEFKQSAIRLRKPLFLAVAAVCAVLFAVQTERSQTRQAAPEPSFPAIGNLSQVMRGILFPNANLIFNVQTHDPSEKKPGSENANAPDTFNWITWGSN